MRILVRLPNWLGDVVMSGGLLHRLQTHYPEARIDVIIKQELLGLVPLLPAVTQAIPFSKKNYPGLRGAWRFGRTLARQEYDLLFCLPHSFSSAVMAYAVRAKERIGYRSEGRAWLLTRAYAKPTNLHRAKEYTYLLDVFTQTSGAAPQVKLQLPADQNTIRQTLLSAPTQPYLVANFNSEAQSRRMPAPKAAQIIQQIQRVYSGQIILIGSAKEADFVQSIEELLTDKAAIVNAAGKTSLPELAYLLQGAEVMVSTDSGPAHLAAGLNTRLLVFFGAGDEARTAPYHQAHVRVLRVENLFCARCLANTCRYGIPNCLLLLDDQVIADQVKALLAPPATP